MSSAGLTIVANVEISRGLALLGAPRFFVLYLFFIAWKGGNKNLGSRGTLSVKGLYMFHTCFTKNVIC